MPDNYDLLDSGLSNSDPSYLDTWGLSDIATTPKTPARTPTKVSAAELRPPPVLTDQAPPLPNNLDLSMNSQATFNAMTLSGSSAFLRQDEQPFHSFAGSDIRVLLWMKGTPAKELLELTTITVSVHREKAPVRALGYTGPKGFGRGKRTIAGTIVLTTFNVDFLYRFLGANYSKDFSKSDAYQKVDQLPPFNLKIAFIDEYGVSSYRDLMGVELVTSGDVYSSQDFYSEQTLSYMAADFTPLVPMGKSAAKSTGDTGTGAQKTPRDLIPSTTSSLNY